MTSTMITLGRKSVSNKDPYIIAEVGSNWHTLEDCMKSIEAAKRSGADAVKFQAFNFKGLYGISGESNAYDKKTQLPLEWVKQLRSKADDQKIDFMCTAFDIDTLRSIDSYVDVHKVASSDMNYEDLLFELAQIGKPVILSTGAHSPTEIELALSTLGSVSIVLMYCVAAYPAKSVNLYLIDRLKEFECPVGFSDHTLDPVYIPSAAIKQHGACVLEKHFTFNIKDTPDAGHSLNPVEFKLMVDTIKGIRTPLIGATVYEQDMLLKHNRRLIATKTIKKGEQFTKGKNFGAYRALEPQTNTLSPFYAQHIEDRIAKRDIVEGSAISSSDFI